MFVTFSFEDDSHRDAVCAIAARVEGQFHGMPGLRSKAALVENAG